MERETPYRFPRTDDGITQWLTAKQLEIARIIDVTWYHTRHGSSYEEFYCPTPEACGWFCSRDDEIKIKQLGALNE